MFSSFNEACDLMLKFGLTKNFEQRCLYIVNNTYELGYGVFDDLSELFERVFETKLKLG
jgi:hypothetical protein